MTERSRDYHEPCVVFDKGKRVVDPLAIVHELARLIGHVYIGAHSVVDDLCFLYAPHEHEIEIGRYVHIASFVSISGGSCKLGDFSSVGPGSRLLVASDSFQGDALVGSAVPARYRKVTRKAITLGQHAVVGANCVIMPGVTIGEGACVGANSFVRHDVPPWTIVAGSPARIINARPRAAMLNMATELLDEERSRK